MTFSSSNKKVVRAVNDVNLDIYRGENIGLVGESGCGKTTFGRAIIRIYNPTSGNVEYDGRDISGKMNASLRKYITQNIAMIFQDPVASLNPRMTVFDIIAEGLKVKGIKERAVLEQEVLSVLDKVGLLPEHAGRYPHEFSGGQRQRIGIARALVTKPAFIIADEPVSALDVSVQAQVINLLGELKEQMDLTILFIAHDLSVVKYFSDRIGVMYYGKLVELADADELYANPLHPYTKSLLSAIPQPDPIGERSRVRIDYDPEIHDYSFETPSFQEVAPNHFVYASDSEFKAYQKSMGNK